MRYIITLRIILIAMLALLLELALLMVHNSYGGGGLVDTARALTGLDITLSILITLTLLVMFLTPLTLLYGVIFPHDHSKDSTKAQGKKTWIQQLSNDREVVLLIGGVILLSAALLIDYALRGDASLMINIPSLLLFFLFYFF